MKLVITLLLVFVSLPITVHASQCNGKKWDHNIKDLNPNDVTTFALMNKDTVKTPGDLMCCLTEQDKNLKVVVMNNSVAAQGGAPAHPRVLLVKTNPKTGKLESVFSINSGADHLGGHNAVEVLSYANPAKEGQLFDIQVPGNHNAPRGPNPQKCMNCHGGGDDGKRQVLGGVKPIFERDPWLRMNDPSATDRAKFRACPNLRKHIDQIRADAEEAFQAKEPYRCLKNLPRMSGVVFDRLIKERNEERIAKQVMASKDFSKFQWAIASIGVCSFTPEEFFPPHQIVQMTNTDAIVDRNIRNSTTVEQTLAEAKKPNPNIDDLLKADSAFIYNKEQTASLPVDLSPCTQSSSFPSLKGSNNIYLKYKVDTDRQSGDLMLANFRYLFETRGIDISDWNTSHLGSYGRSPSIWKVLAEHPMANADLKTLIKNKDCAGLKKRSIAAFGSPPKYSDEELNNESTNKVQ